MKGRIGLVGLRTAWTGLGNPCDVAVGGLACIVMSWSSEVRDVAGRTGKYWRVG